MGSTAPSGAWSKQSLVGAALVSLLAGACGGGGNPGDGPGTAGTGTGLGGSAGGAPAPAARRPRSAAATPAPVPRRVRDVSARAVRLHLRLRPLQGTARLRRPGRAQHLRAARDLDDDHSVESLLYGDVLAIRGSASNDVFAGDSWGSVIRWNGATWQLASDFGVKVTTISGSSRSDVWFGLGDGTVWQLVGTDLTKHQVAGRAISALAGEPDGRVRVRFDHLLALGRPDLGHERARGHRRRGRVGRPGGPLWVVSNHGWMDRWDGQAWTEVFTRGTGHQFLSIRGIDASHIWAAGTIFYLRYDGSNWWTAGNPGQLLGYYTSVWPAAREGRVGRRDRRPDPARRRAVLRHATEPDDDRSAVALGLGTGRHLGRRWRPPDAPLHRRPRALTRRRGDFRRTFASRHHVVVRLGRGQVVDARAEVDRLIVERDRDRDAAAAGR